MIEKIYQIIGFACIACIFIQFEPIQKQIDKLNNLPGKIYPLIAKIFSCTKCFSFWFSLIITQDIMQACIISIIAQFINNNISTIRL